MKVTQSSLTVCDLVDYTVHGILQARILEWVPFPFSRESSQPRDRTQVSHIVGRFFTSWATQVKPKNTGVGSLSLLQEIFPTQESNWGLLYCRQILYQLSYQGSPCALFFRPVWLFVTLWTVAWWAPLSIGLSRQEYWSGLPCLPPGILLTQGSNPCVSCFLLHLASLHLLNLKTLHSKV